jgi:hypothetical protein
MAMVPLEECRIPTLIPSPTGAALADAVVEAADEAVELAVVVVVVGVQDFSKMLPAALDPRIRISLRRNFLAIKTPLLKYSVFILAIRSQRPNIAIKMLGMILNGRCHKVCILRYYSEGIRGRENWLVDR